MGILLPGPQHITMHSALHPGLGISHLPPKKFTQTEIRDEGGHNFCAMHWHRIRNFALDRGNIEDINRSELGILM